MKISNLNDVDPIRTYLARIGAEPRSLKSAVVKEQRGKYWKDLAIIRFTREGDIKVSSPEFAPTELEAAAIKGALASATWPELVKLKRIISPPKMIAEAKQDSVFEFRDLAGNIVMVQVRIEKDGDKAYVPWTYWDDKEWRCTEPEGPLPLFNADKLKDAAAVFLHEGAKAARYVQWMVEGKTAEAKKALRDHPWGQELTAAAHLGWIGGALSPSRTDFSPIMAAGVKCAYIVADNDEAGRAAVPAIARQLRIPTFLIQFTSEFPASFDLADAFPKKMFGRSEQFYIGPAFRDCLHPATWATDLIAPPEGKGKPKAFLRDSFKSMWAYVEEADFFVCREMPEIIRSEPILNKMLAPFSDVAETSRLIAKAFRGRSARVCYRPDIPGLEVTYRGSSAINLHVPTTIREKEGDPQPWLDFLDYLFINPDERKEVERWCATLIARPDIRMSYGLLLISESQGVGKTTLGSTILGPLVGPTNVSHPSESQIESDFNDWIANKRLAVISEIYSGSSWKIYHALKSLITDPEVTVNQKYQRQYVIDNWCHIIACSNSMRALKMENDDRRWFYPEVTEVPWPREKFEKLRAWLHSGGLAIIKQWALEYEDYVKTAERAPMTERKREMIDGSRSEAQQEAAALAEHIASQAEPLSVAIKDVVGWCRENVQGKIYDTDYELRKTMIEAGLSQFPKRIKVGTRTEYVLMNNALRDIVQRSADQAAVVRQHLKRANDLMQSRM